MPNSLTGLYPLDAGSTRPSKCDKRHCLQALSIILRGRGHKITLAKNHWVRLRLMLNRTPTGGQIWCRMGTDVGMGAGKEIVAATQMCRGEG